MERAREKKERKKERERERERDREREREKERDCEKERELVMGLVRITSWYPNFNGSHFGLPPSEIHRMTGLPPKIV